MRVTILTLGCKVNQAESTTIEGALKSAGHSIVDISEEPDFCIINTCTVTSKSDYQSRQLIRRANRIGARIIVTGCYSELNSQYVRSLEGVEAVISNLNKLSIINLLDKKNINTSFLNFKPELSKRSRFFIKVQDGCNFSCSYCAIPKARGRSRSISPVDVISQVNDAVSNGLNEIVLTGIHLGTYGFDLKPKVTLSYLLKIILIQTKIKRIRLSSIEVKEIDDELLELMSNQRICNHLHIPLQSGDDKILRLMNRSYNSRLYCKSIENIFRKISDIAIGTDAIVGFPGEDSTEFENTYRLLECLPIAYMHIFPFSPRQGTLASKMPDTTPSVVKKERVHLLESLKIRKKMAYINSQIGKTLDALIEECNCNGICTGRVRNYLKIQISNINQPRGSLIYVKVDGINNEGLVGSPIFSQN